MVPSRLGPQGEARAVKYAFFPEPCEGKSAEFKRESESQWSDWTKRRDFGFPTKPWAKSSTPPYDEVEKYSHDYLRRNLKTKLLKGPACFGLMLQLYRDQKSTNIEDSTDIWLSSAADKKDWISKVEMRTLLHHDYFKAYFDRLAEKEYSPYIKVATLKISQIPIAYPATNTKTCEDLSFSPWNGNIKFHKPLGVVSRMKRRVYNASRTTRHTINDLPTKDWERPAN